MVWAAVGAAAVGAIIGAGTSIYIANKNEEAQKDLYNTQYAAEKQSALANAEAHIRSAEAEAGAQIASAQAEGSAIIAGAKASAGAARQSADAAYSDAYNNIALMQAEANESLRKLETTQTAYEEKAKARAAASGGQFSGSQAMHVENMDEENTKQYTYLSGAYTSQQQVARANADAVRAAQYGYADSLVQGAQKEAEARQAAAGFVADAYRAVAGNQYNAAQQAYA